MLSFKMAFETVNSLNQLVAKCVEKRKTKIDNQLVSTILSPQTISNQAFPSCKVQLSFKHKN